MKIRLHCFRTLRETLSNLQQKEYRKVVKTVFYVFREHFEEKDIPYLLLVFLLIFRLWANIFLPFGKKFSAKLSNLLSTRSHEHLEEDQFFDKNHLHLLSEFEWNIFWPRAKFYRKVSKDVFYVFGKHSDETHFSEFFLIFVNIRNLGKICFDF